MICVTCLKNDIWHMVNILSFCLFIQFMRFPWQINWGGLSFLPPADLLEKSLMLLKIEGTRRRGCQRLRWLDGITNAMDMNLGKLQEMVRGWEA